MTDYNQFFFSGTLVDLSFFRLGKIRAFSDAWSAQKKFLTELISAISAVQFSFTTFFQFLNLVRFCSYSKLKLSNGFSLQWWKPFVDIFFHLWEISKQTLGNIKKSSNFEKRERKYANTWGSGGRARGQKSLQSHFCCMPFVFRTICFHSAGTFMRF